MDLTLLSKRFVKCAQMKYALWYRIMYCLLHIRL